MNLKVAGAFKKLYFGKRTGLLTCEAKDARRAVYFQSGFVVGAKSSREEDRLGEVMMRHGRITREQFKDASHFIKSGWRLGQILVELNVLDEGEIEAFVRLQLLDIACMQLITPPRRLAFAPLSEVDAYLEAPLSVADILMEAARRTPKIDRELERFKEENRKLGFPKDPFKRFQDVNLKPQEAFVLSRIDGTQTVNDLFAMSPISEEQTARTLMGLVAAELVEVEGEHKEPEESETSEEETVAKAHVGKAPRVSETGSRDEAREREIASVERLYQELQFKDFWQVLELERGASLDEVKKAFFRRARSFHPDRFRRITDPSFQEKVSFIFRRIREAYETLSSDSRKSYEALADKDKQYQAAQEAWLEPGQKSPSRPAGSPDGGRALFLRAKRAYDLEDFWQSIQLVQEAIDMTPDRAEYYHLLGLALSKNPKWRQDAEKNLKIAANLDPWKADYQLALGRLYETAGLHLRAKKAFEQAKAIDPNAETPEV